MLRWPEHLGKAEFIDQIAALRPDEPIPPNLRLRYRNLIFPKAWENLQLIIDMRRPKPLENAAAGKAGGPPTAPMGPIDPSMVELIGIVDWSLANRTDLEARYFFDPNQPPTDKKVRLTQEDLWVFEDMCVVIAGTNKYVAKEQGVELDTGNAAIKRIESLDVAQWAVDAAQKDRPIVWLPPQSGLGESNANPGMNMSGPGAMSYGDAGAAGAVPLSAADMETKADELLLDGRYLKDDGQPLPATELTGTPPYTEFKQIFIRMKLMVDQRRIPELLTACANAPLPIEVRRLRVESMGDAAAGQAGAMPGAMPGMMPPGMGGHGGGLEGGKGMGGMKMGGGGGDRFGGEMPRGGPPAMPPPGAMAHSREREASRPGRTTLVWSCAEWSRCSIGPTKRSWEWAAPPIRGRRSPAYQALPSNCPASTPAAALAAAQARLALAAARAPGSLGTSETKGQAYGVGSLFRSTS